MKNQIIFSKNRNSMKLSNLTFFFPLALLASVALNPGLSNSNERKSKKVRIYDGFFQAYDQKGIVNFAKSHEPKIQINALEKIQIKSTTKRVFQNMEVILIAHSKLGSKLPKFFEKLFRNTTPKLLGISFVKCEFEDQAETPLKDFFEQTLNRGISIGINDSKMSSNLLLWLNKMSAILQLEAYKNKKKNPRLEFDKKMLDQIMNCT